jgi:ATP-dependent RNA helicase DeaD
MGFIDDVEWVLEQSPADRQIALFSATMPQQIRRIATRHLKAPAQITIQTKTTTVDTIRQRFWPVSGMHKLDALTRILEAEQFDAMLVFVRTKTSTLELAEKLAARGYESAALNGDIPQNQRERTIQQLKNGKLDIVVATDVAARGLDVERISHVINYDIPYDTEAYVHRIGRTGRAGRQGDAILFVAPRERRMLGAIEKATRQKITLMELPSTELINDKRIAKFQQRITDTLANENLELFTQLIEQYQQEHNVPSNEIAAALARILQGDTPLLLQNKPQRKPETSWDSGDKPPRRNQPRGKPTAQTTRKDSPPEGRNKPHGKPPARTTRGDSPPEDGMERFRLEVGHKHNVKPGNIVGAIANEAGVDSQHIGRINIFDDYSLVDLPEGMPKGAFNNLRKAWVGGQLLKISRFDKDAKPAVAKEHPARKNDGKVKTYSKKSVNPKGSIKKKVRKKKPSKTA